MALGTMVAMVAMVAMAMVAMVAKTDPVGGCRRGKHAGTSREHRIGTAGAGRTHGSEKTEKEAMAAAILPKRHITNSKRC